MKETIYHLAWMDENDILQEDEMRVTNFECDKCGFAVTFESKSIWSANWDELPNIGIYDF